MTIARRYLYETADAVRLEALADGSWPPLADLVGKLRREERYHQMHIGAWLERLAVDGRRAARAPARRPRHARTPCRDGVHAARRRKASLVEAGVLARPMADLERDWRASRRAGVRADSDLPLAAGDRRIRGSGRTDHGEPFRWLWGEFTTVRRSDPGATW